MESPSDPPIDRAWHACASCKARKRKCDKALPTCALCQSKGWVCDYESPKSQSPRNQGPTGPGAQSYELSHHQYDGQSLDHLSSLAVFFLDVHTFHQSRLEILRPDIQIPPEVQSLNGDEKSIQAMATEYFKTVHESMPIISKQRFYMNWLNPLTRPRTDVALLLLCMRLVSTQVPDGVPPSQTLIYQVAKQVCFGMESRDNFSLQVLQARILIAVYEVGHAIYPAAYMTIGSCARQGISLGIDGRKGPQADHVTNWIDIEERKRAWWAVLILDRFVNLGNPTRALATEEPDSSSVIPIDDEAWDKGVLPLGNSFTLLSPSSIDIGRFARLAQATYLLGQVLRHITDSTVDEGFREEEAAQLRRTICALVNVSEIESQIRSLEFCTQTAICHSAILILEDFYTHTVGKPLCGIESQMSIAETASRVCRIFLRLDHKICSRKVSPLVLNLLYRTSAIYAEMNSKTGIEEYFEASEVIKNAMGLLDKKWKAAGAYLEILRAREVMYSG